MSDALQHDGPARAELPKQYRPKDHESRVFAAWLKHRAFHADPTQVLSGQRKPYAIVIPPPNVTDRLHLGHALNNTLQDVLARAHRMMGFETLWMPGTDHAGIATQAVVERRVMKEEKKRRSDFSRDAFVAKIQAFKDEYEAVITGQLKAMGCSCDWERQRFTMDPQCARAVREAFFRLFADGLIYRGKRLVNWDPALQTAVADDECYDEEVDSSFWYLRYPLVHARHGEDPVPVTWNELSSRGYPGADSHSGELQAWVTVATTRPETYLADTAVAVNPHDPRAVALRGLSVQLPLIGRVIPIIEDSYVVLPKAMARTEDEARDPKAEFATGFLKVTPGHDANDYEIGVRHKLPIVNMMSPDGRVSDKHDSHVLSIPHALLGKKMHEARAHVAEEFKRERLLEAVRPYRHSIKHSDRSKAVIEPYLSDQWYVKVTDPRLAKAANEILGSELGFHPERYAKTYQQWHDGIRDWCISRQLWWGHRIPVWSLARRTFWHDRTGKLQEYGIDLFLDDLRTWVRQRKLQDSIALEPCGEVVFACARDDAAAAALDSLKPSKAELPGEKLEDWLLAVDQDPDVLDTWFSSALWPMSTMGWPDSTELLRAFNPTSTLCTAREIITLWVSRMVMFNRYLMPADWPETGSPTTPSGQGRGPVPFHDVFIHAVIQDGEGRKMSKSLGNGVDPLDIIESHGSDAMRFTLCQMTTQTQDVRMPVVKDSTSGRNTSPKFDLGRNFANKLWNAARFAIGMLRDDDAGAIDASRLTLADRWMLSRVASACETVTRAIREYEFSVYAQTMYDLLWRDFCDWYLEAIKPTVAENPTQRAVLRASLDAILRLLHPVMPFVTEAIFEHLPKGAPIHGLTLGSSRRGGLLCLAGWPVASPSLRDEAAEAAFDRVRGLISAIREVRSAQNVAPKRTIVVHMPGGGAWAGSEPAASLVRTLAGVRELTPNSPAGASSAFAFEGQEWRLSDLADAVDAGAERSRLTKLIADLEKSMATLEARLANPGYAQKAPPAMVQQTKDQLAKAAQEREAAAAALAKLPSA